MKISILPLLLLLLACAPQGNAQIAPVSKSVRVVGASSDIASTDMQIVQSSQSSFRGTQNKYSSSSSSVSDDIIASIVVGLALLIGMPFVMWMVEKDGEEYALILYRCHKATREIEDCTQPVNPKLEGWPVFLSGPITLKNPATRITDQETGFTFDAPAVRLRRIVEVYQWVESKRNDEKEYNLQWVETDHYNNSSTAHKNPVRSPSLYSITWDVADAVKVGQYTLSSAQIDKLQKWEPCKTLPKDLAPKLVPSFARITRPRRVITDGSYTSACPCMSASLVYEDCDCLVFNGDLVSPVCGTMRVSYEVLPIGDPAESTVSLVGVQDSNGSFRPFDGADAHRQLSIKKMKKQVHVKQERSALVSLLYTVLCCMTIEDSVLLVEERETNADQLFYDEKTTLFKRMSLLRVVSCFLFGLGLYFVLNPISYLFFWLPFLQSLIQSIFFLVAMIFGFVVGYLIIAIAWLNYHPERLLILLILLGGYLISSAETYKAGLVTFLIALYPLHLTIIHFYEEWKYSCMVAEERLEVNSVESQPLLKDHVV